MPVIIPKDLISAEVLQEEKIFVMKENRAEQQDIRPLKVGIVNLMPKKEVTEIQLLRMLSNTALQLEIDLIRMGTYKPKNSNIEHLNRFYKTYEEIKDDKYDALIVTGAPVERLDYDEIKYWDELRLVFDFAKENVYSTMFICWGAQAGLHYFYDIPSILKEDKIFGVYEYEKLNDDKLFKGFDDLFYVPQSRYTMVEEKEILKHEDLKVLATREDSGISLVTSKDYRFVFNFGHWEYDEDTLHKEYVRDLSKGLDIEPAENYYRNDDPEQGIVVKWRAAGSLFFSNWINYCVYQDTPYDLEEIEKKKVAKFGGSSLSDAGQFRKVKAIIQSEDDRDVIVVSAPGKRDSLDSKITDDLIRVSESQKELRDLEEIIRKINTEIDAKEAQKSQTLDLVKNRFFDIADDLGLGERARKILDETFSEILQSDSSDFIISRGEYLSARLMADYLGYSFVDAKDIIFFNEDGTLDYHKSQEEIISKIPKGKKVVIPGFYGQSHDGNVKLFDRGGSDFTGSIIAASLDSEVYENWTDVPGIMTEDPRKSKNAKTISEMDYEDLTLMIEDGAEVYQKDAIQHVKDKNIILKILNTNDPENKGTEIKNKNRDEKQK